MAITDSYITLDEVVDNAATTLRGSDNFDRNLMRQWAAIGERQIGFHLGAVKNCKIDVVDLSIKKPMDYVNKGLDEMGIFTSDGKEIRYTYRGYGKPVLPKRNAREFTVEVTEDAHYWHLDSTAEGAAYAHIRYYGFPTDEDGMPLIPAHHLLALMYFCRYMYGLRNPDMADPNAEQQRWTIEAAKARNKNKIPSRIELREIAKDWMHMLNAGVKRYQDY